MEYIDLQAFMIDVGTEFDHYEIGERPEVFGVTQ
jgi:hypothetical protein